MVTRLSALALAACALLLPASAQAAPENWMQDDDLLVYAQPATVEATLDEMVTLGVDRLRVSLFWRLVAPQPTSQVKPAGFDGTDPAAYAPGAWERYDRLVAEAKERGIGINFDVTGPAPSWATGTPARKDIEPTFEPDPAEFGAFVTAAGTRYSGAYVPTPAQGDAPPSRPGGSGLPLLPLAEAAQAPGALPRVANWGIWNEPNQAGWLTPQWQGGVEVAPRRYRALVDAAYAALVATTHGRDTILIGETAPKGLVALKGTTRSIDALRFVRVLYCVSRTGKPLKGIAARARGCPEDAAGSRRFADDHPGLFAASGFAHHPYELTFAPDRAPTRRDWVTIANLPRLTGVLDEILTTYGKRRSGGMPLWLTEFGYQTRPPDRVGVSWATQARYLDYSAFLAYVNPRARALNQFLLRDDGAPISRTFQSGLRTEAGKAKPALAAYRLPIHLPSTVLRRDRGTRIFGLLRPGAKGKAVTLRVEQRLEGAKAWRLVRRVRTTTDGVIDQRVRLLRPGSVRLAAGTSASAIRSREVAVRVAKKRA